MLKGMKHTLSEVDVENRRGVCAICGPTRLRSRGVNRPGHRLRCAAAGLLDPESKRDQARSRRLRDRYGLTPDALDRLVLQQEGRCALCEKPRPLDVDHDHTTKRVRGLLCNPCNRALGLLGDDVAGLQRALAYLTS